MKLSESHADDPVGVGLNAQAWDKLKKAQQEDARIFAAYTEGYSVFSTAVGKASRWFKGCPCHKWGDPDGDDCWRKGRRASDLARGAASTDR